jgi:hypothetical protein
MEEDEEGRREQKEKMKNRRMDESKAAIGLAEKLAAGFMPMPEPAERLAQGLQQIFGQIRQSSSIISAGKNKRILEDSKIRELRHFCCCCRIR